MRIIYIYQSLAIWGGIERILVEKMNYLVSHYGFDVYMFTTDQGNHEIPYHLDNRVKFVDFGIQFHFQYRYNGIKRVYDRWQRQRKLRLKIKQKVKQVNPDVIVCASSELIPMIIGACKGVPVIYEAHNIFNQTYKKDSGIWDRMVASLKNSSLRNVDKIVALTDGDASEWRKINNHVEVIPNLVNLNKEHYSNYKNKKAIFVGRLTEQKGITDLIDIWHRVNRTHPDWCLEIYGEGELEEFIVRKISELGLNIIINKPTSNIHDKYRDCSFLLMASTYEPFGLVIPEAMSCGLPVVAFDCPYGPSVMIEDGKNGFLIKDRNVQDFAKAVCALIDDNSRLEEIGNHARNSVSRYSDSLIMPQWVKMFERLMQKQKQLYFSGDTIPLEYWDVPNFGDMLSPFIIEHFSGKKILHKECYRGIKYVILETLKRISGKIKKPLGTINYPYQRNLLCVGSIISWGNGSSVVWGSGFMNEYDGFRGDKVFAVRGALTDDKLRRMGYPECKVYGDPAILLPMIYRPDVIVKHKVGIIPHITETDYFINNYGKDFCIIDLRTRDVHKVIDEVCSCSMILSTSLHGIITAHAYGIPALWIKKHHINTDGFKFKDYFSSVGIDLYDGFENIDEILKDEHACMNFMSKWNDIALPKINLDCLRNKLLDAAPFKVINHKA